jgi:hypothetical protein
MDISAVVVVLMLVVLFFGGVIWMELQSRKTSLTSSLKDKKGPELDQTDFGR